MIGISTQTFDVDGSMILTKEVAESNIVDRSRRVSRTATLDGSTSITDSGFSDADRTFKIRTKELDKSGFDQLANIHAFYALVVITSDEGAFIGAIETINMVRGFLNITILIKEKVSA